jgi:hypothetical protein
LLFIAIGALVLELLSIGGLSTYVIKFSQRRLLIKNGLSYIKIATLGMSGILLLLGAWLSAPTTRRACFSLSCLPSFWRPRWGGRDGVI